MFEPGMQLWLIALICFALGGVAWGQDNRSFRRPSHIDEGHNSTSPSNPHEHHRGKRSLPSGQQMNEIVSTHNAFRRLQMSSDMKMMKWNDYLGSMASEWAQNCTFARGQPYRDPSTIPFPRIGQNMYASPSLPLNFTSVIQTWYNQGASITSTNSCNPGQSCNNYLQLVFANTSDVGCGYANCPSVRGLSTAYRNSIFVICYYGPGQVSGVKPFKIGPACTECFETNSLCITQLCASQASPDTVSTKATTQPYLTTAATSMKTTTQTTTQPIATTEPIVTTATSPLPTDATTQPDMTTAATFEEGTTTQITTEESTANGGPSTCTCACSTTLV